MYRFLSTLLFVLAASLAAQPLHAQSRRAAPEQLHVVRHASTGNPAGASGARPALRAGEQYDRMTGAPTTPAEAARRFRAYRDALRAAAQPTDAVRRRAPQGAAVRPAPSPEAGGPVFVVDNAYDDPDVTPGDGLCATSFSDCTLRAAIEEANATAGTAPVTVTFGIFFGPPGSQIAPGVWRIQPNVGGFGGLPTVTRTNVVLDASTQASASCGALTAGTPHALRVVLDGALLTGTEPGLVAAVGASGFVARGFAVGNFPGRGIVFGENVANLFSNSLVECNYVGTDWTGEVAQPNVGGVEVRGGSLFFLFGVTVRNNLVSGNFSDGLYVTRQRVTIAENIVGLDDDGTQPLGNLFGGMRIVNADVTVDGNVISANGTSGPGIELGALTGPFAPSARRVTVTDNMIGLDRTGLGTTLGNGFFGVWVHEGASDNDIGLPGAGNFIAYSGGDSDQSGIVISGTGTNDNRIRGNRIGLNLFGVAAPNFQGVFVGDAFSEGAPSGTVVGEPGGGNDAAGNRQYGIYLAGDLDTRVEGNTPGLDVCSGLIFGNERGGINLDGSTNPVVRDNSVNCNLGTGISAIDDFSATGATTGALVEDNRIGIPSTVGGNFLSGLALLDAVGVTVTGNTIVANADAGIYLEGASEVVIEGNYIGTDAGATLALGNGLAGIYCQSATDVRIGSPTGVPFNTIAFNGGDGIYLATAGCQNVAVLTNRIFDNAGLGVDLAPNGMTPNDPDDLDAGPNALTNFPVVTSATNDGANSVVTYTLDALPNQSYRVQLYRSTSADPSGFGEGAVAVFAPVITTDANGQAAQTLTLTPSQFPVGVWVAGLATPVDATTFSGFRGTSEFGPAVQVQEAGAAPLIVTITPTSPPPPVVLARGQRVFFDLTFEVGPTGPSSFEYWTEATLPNSSVTGPLLGPSTVNVTPPQTVALSFSQRVPNNAPLGSYTYTVHAGTFPGTVLDSDAFAATVTTASRQAEASAREGNENTWLAYDAAGRLVEAGLVHDVRTDVVSATAEGPQASGSASTPSVFALHGGYPNPFNPSTTVRFDVPEATEVTVEVLDLLGRRVALLADGYQEAGAHSVRFEAGGLPSGVYLVRMQTDTFAQVQRVTLLR